MVVDTHFHAISQVVDIIEPVEIEKLRLEIHKENLHCSVVEAIALA